jgi:hypothetical protein
MHDPRAAGRQLYPMAPWIGISIQGVVHCRLSYFYNVGR